MFDDLSRRFSSLFSRLRGEKTLTEEAIQAAIREVRKALLEADVNLQVVRRFTERVREQAVGTELLEGVEPGEQFVKIVHDEIVALLGGEEARIAWSDRRPTVIMMVGLQGTGKTTTTAKLALQLKKREGKKPLMVAADVQRPAAIEQLKVLGQQIDVPVYFEDGGRPPKICKRGLAKAQELGCDVVLLDTAGRLHIDNELMDELEDIRDKIKPEEIWLAVDAMQGQDAVTSAREFNDRLEISGVVLTKTDGDARGGAALAVREVTTKPIRYVGVGEKLDKLERFVPERMAGRILGMGDVVSLVEEAQDKIDQEQAQEAAERLFMDRFSFEDMRFQFQSLLKMGSLGSLLKKLPGGQEALAQMQGQPDALPDNQQITRWVAIIDSMTPAERMDASVIHMQRRHRIARGSGTSIKDVNEIIKMHKQMGRQVREMKKQGGMMARMAERQMKKGKKKRLDQLKKEGKSAGMSGWFSDAGGGRKSKSDSRKGKPKQKRGKRR